MVLLPPSVVLSLSWWCNPFKVMARTPSASLPPHTHYPHHGHLTHGLGHPHKGSYGPRPLVPPRSKDAYQHSRIMNGSAYLSNASFSHPLQTYETSLGHNHSHIHKQTSQSQISNPLLRGNLSVELGTTVQCHTSMQSIYRIQTTTWWTLSAAPSIATMSGSFMTPLFVPSSVSRTHHVGICSREPPTTSFPSSAPGCSQERI